MSKHQGNRPGDVARAATPVASSKPELTPPAAEPDNVEPEGVVAPSEPLPSVIVEPTAPPVVVGVALIELPVATPAVKPPRYRVWKHGSLHCDHGAFEAGEELPLTEAEIATLPAACIERIPD